MLFIIYIYQILRKFTSLHQQNSSMNDIEVEEEDKLPPAALDSIMRNSLSLLEVIVKTMSEMH